jgi:site-specific DNA-methyltransferase (adenine-specific)
MYQIKQGDCLELMQSIPDKSIDMVFTDPPYLYLKHKLDAQFPEQKFFEECWRILKDDSILSFFGRGKSFYRWNYICEQIGFEFKEEIIWYKKYCSSPVLTLQRVHETISILQKGNRSLNKVYINKIESDSELNPLAIENDLKRIISELKKIKTHEDFSKFMIGDYSDTRKKAGITIGAALKNKNRAYQTFDTHNRGKILSSIIPEGREHYTMEHPTQKPINLLDKVILLCSNEKDTILDPFMGSGSTGVSCLRTNRDFIGFEILPEYYSLAKKLIEQEADKTALFNYDKAS